MSNNKLFEMHSEREIYRCDWNTFWSESLKRDYNKTRGNEKIGYFYIIDNSCRRVFSCLKKKIYLYIYIYIISCTANTELYIYIGFTWWNILVTVVGDISKLVITQSNKLMHSISHACLKAN